LCHTRILRTSNHRQHARRKISFALFLDDDKLEQVLAQLLQPFSFFKQKFFEVFRLKPRREDNLKKMDSVPIMNTSV
jgi:hypothetical protein